MNKLFAHIPFDRLSDLIEGRVPPDERARLEAHLAGCARCSGEAARLEHLIGLMRTDASEAAPPPVIARAVSLLRPRAAPADSAAEPAASVLRQRILAVLRFDSLGLAPAYGVRSGEPGARQLIFSAGAYDLDLRVEPAGQAWVVSGQLLGESAGVLAELQGAASTGQAARVAQAALNEQSEFTLPPIPAGDYQLILHLSDVEVEVGPLEIGT